MSSRGDLFFCAIFILSSIMLMATTSSLSINFKVYAADNCDATSTCTNVDNGISNDLNNDCRTNSNCVNTADGNSNTNSNNCRDNANCGNVAIGNLNNLNNICRDSVCDNNVVGDSNTVNNICIDSNCFHPFSDAEGRSNTLNRNCQGIIIRF